MFSRASGRSGVPVALLFLGLGMAVGGFRHEAFRDYALAVRLGTAALVAILFDGGLNTPAPSLARAIRPASLLATVGVAATAAVVALAARVLPFGWHFGWTEALLLGAIVSSTDAASVFSVLRGSGLQLKQRVGVTLEVESGLNDPMAVLLTVELTRCLVEHRGLGLGMLAQVPLELGVGAALGGALGLFGRWLLRRARLPATGLYPVLTLALSFVAFGLPPMLHGSGFLSVYVTAVILGNGPLPCKSGLLRVHDTIAWFGQITMFFFLGLLASPLQIWHEAGGGLVIALVLALVARPLATALCLFPFRYPPREVAYIGWVGLRGAVPIILATLPVLARADAGPRLFNLVFCVVVVNALLPGGTVRWVTRRLGLQSRHPPAPHAVLEISSTRPLGGEVISFFVDAASAVTGASVADVELPDGASVMLVLRGDELIGAQGNAPLQPGDHVYVFCRPEDRPFIQLLFGRAEDD